ncbi:AAA family ATPase [Ramlibacter sp. AN1015]|uniref:AAA family ATPase n=1 Tax=Ramlibacter sp. AN1015 TaxID=3133428 RepID=UPI0030BFDBD2
MPKRSKPYLIRADYRPGLDIDFDAYPFSIPAVRELGSIDFHPNVTFFVGENGAGKSTVLEALALALGFGSEGGTRNVQLKSVESVSPLHDAMRLARGVPKPKDGYFLRAESFFNLATYMDQTGYLDGYGGRSLHRQSHGEAFMSVLMHKMRGDGIYLLDEPEAALSPNRQLAALRAIHQLVEDASQFVIATHSPILLSYPHAKIIQFDGAGLTEVAFEDTEHYVVTKDFLNHHARRLDQLLASDDAGHEDEFAG